MKVLTFSRVFPAYHPKKGKSTHFVEKIWSGINEDFSKTLIGLDYETLNFCTNKFDPKYHTIRGGNRWKVGDWFSPRVWSDKPYRSKQIEFAPPIEIKKVFNIVMEGYMIHINEENVSWLHNSELAVKLSINDGLSVQDFWDWFPYKTAQRFTGQIICWNENINY